MTRYTPRQVAAVAAMGGFRGKGLTRAVAVALAESGGDSQAVNVNTDSTHSRDRGLWQINSHWHSEVSDAQAFNPVECARAAFRISGGGANWSEWSTWKNGTAGAQLGRARIAVAQLERAGGAESVADKIPGFPDPLIPLIPDPFGALPGDGLLDPNSLPWAGLGDAVKQIALLTVKTGAWLSDSHNWLRVAWMAGGTVGVLIALSMIGKSGAAGDTVKKAAALPGKAAKTAANVAMVAGTGGAGAAAKGAAAAGKATKAAAAAGKAAAA